MTNSNPLARLPSVEDVVSELQPSLAVARPILVNIARAEIDTARRRLKTGEAVSRAEIVSAVGRTVGDLLRPKLDPVINATGVILHTNLGRAPVSDATARAMAEAAANAVPLELDRESGKRGGRMGEITRLMRHLSGAEATLVVNNNAAAVLLVVAALGGGREVLVSRGEAVEIGGGFRVPDVVAQSGCRLVDVGTTNKTYVADFERAITTQAALVLRVHPSNFLIEGFAASPATPELAALCTARSIPLVFDAGSGALIDSGQFGLKPEPTLGQLMSDGVDIVTASGDKLLGGPQAGLICGRREFVERAASHPLARALRADKATLAGVAATLRHYLQGDHLEQVPVWRMISAPIDAIRARAERVASDTGLSVIDTQATIGGGSLPGATLPSVGVVAAETELDATAKSLRIGQPPVYGRTIDGRLVLDMRTVRPEQDTTLTRALISARRTAEQ